MKECGNLVQYIKSFCVTEKSFSVVLKKCFNELKQKKCFKGWR